MKLKGKSKKQKAAKNKFMGPIITAQNRNEFIKQYKEQYLQKIDNEGNPDNLNELEMDLISTRYAKLMISKEKKHLKAYLKGSSAGYYNWRGDRYPIMDTNFMNRMKSYQEEQEKQKEEVKREGIQTEEQIEKAKEEFVKEIQQVISEGNKQDK